LVDRRRRRRTTRRRRRRRAGPEFEFEFELADTRESAGKMFENAICVLLRR
jgi:hypothetical protein